MKPLYHSLTKYIRNKFVANIFIFIALNLSFCTETFSQPNSKAQKFYVNNILRPILKHDYRNFEYRVIVDSNSYYKLSEGFTNKVFRNKKEVAFIDNHINQYYYLFRKDYFKCIDKETLELTKGINTTDESYDNEYFTKNVWHYNNRCRSRVNEFIELINRNNLGLKDYSLYNVTLGINFSRMFDTVINNVLFTAVSRDDTTSHFYNDETEKFDIPNFYTISYYYNTVEKRLQYIHSRPMDYPGNRAKLFDDYKIEINITFEDNRRIIDSIFDFEQDMYKNYSRHNNTDNLPISWTYHYVKKETLNDTVLDYPIVSLHDNRTTTLRNQEGWTLVYFWSTGCKPCLKTIKELSENTKKIGLQYIEEHNINFMMVNPLAGNAESIKRYVERYGINHVIYHSKGFSNIFKTNVFPTIILISPDKKTFYRLNSLDDLSAHINQ